MMGSQEDVVSAAIGGSTADGRGPGRKGIGNVKLSATLRDGRTFSCNKQRRKDVCRSSPLSPLLNACSGVSLLGSAFLVWSGSLVR